MKLIYRYLSQQIILSTVFALICLLSLYGFIDIVGELTKIGKGSYTFLVMLTYVAMKLPSHAYELMPLAVLIGCMSTMTQLSTHSEYTIIRTSGVSLFQIGKVLLCIGVLFTLLSIFLGELVTPSIEAKAERMHLSATKSVVAHNFHSGIWLKDKNNIINVREMLPDNTLTDIHIYTYNDNYQLTQSRHAQTASYQGRGYWHLNNVADTDISENKTHVATYKTLEWKSIIEPNILKALLVSPRKMSASNLVTYINHLLQNQQKTQPFRVALWGKLFYPIACISMSLVALAFIPRQRRHGQLGINLFLGICIGVTFNFVNRLFGFLSIRYDWSPILSSMLPTILLLIIGLLVIIRQEQH